MKKLIVIILLLILTTGCNEAKEENKVREITADEAKKMIDETEGEIILDVRSREEYNEIHIKDAINMTADEIPSRFAKEITDEKDTLILVYCKSGVRARNAVSVLAKEGYTNVYAFGGINDWKYEVIE